MKKNSIAVIIPMLIIISLFLLIIILVTNTQISVEKFEAIIDIDENGDMNVSETWIVNWPSDMSVSFRDIAYNKYNKNNPLRQDPGNTASFNHDVIVEVYDKNSRKLNSNEYRVGFSFNNDKDELRKPIECYPARSECESIFIQVYNGMDPRMTFKYNYKIEGAVTKYQDIAELNWRLLDYFESGINDAKITIDLPKTNKDSIHAWGHGLGKGEVIIEDSKVILDIDKIKKDEFLEFRILFPKDLVNVDPKNELSFTAYNQILEYQQKLAEETNRNIIVASLVFYGVFVVAFIMIFVFTYIYKKYDKEFKASFEGEYYRELPKDYSPAEMSYLYYFKKINNEDVTATLLDLIRRKHLELDTVGENINKKFPDFKIRLLSNRNDKLLPHESHLINWFINQIGDTKEVSLHQIENYPKDNIGNARRFEENANTFVRLAMNSGSKHDFFEDGNKNKAYGFVVIPLLYLFIAFVTQTSFNIDNMFAIIVSIVLAVGLLIYVSTIQKRSVNGNEDYVKWKAFKKFLEEFSLMKDYPMPAIVVWEQYLVYATSLKIADKVMSQLEVRLPSIQGTESFNQSTFIGFGYRYYGFHFGYTLGRLNTTVNTARNSSIRTIQSHNASRVSGIGRGGGFGGGSSFGGGGGGFRGR